MSGVHGGMESVRFHVAGEDDGELSNVGVCFGLIGEGLEEQAVLEGRERELGAT